MSTLVLDCPRCNAKRSTFDCYASNLVGYEGGWQEICEIYGICRSCRRGATALVGRRHGVNNAGPIFTERNKLIEGSNPIDPVIEFYRFVSSVDNAVNSPPENLPEAIETVMREANKCLSVQCFNAAGAMYRLALDLATKVRLPPEGQDPNAKIRRSLGLRLEWMFKNGTLPAELAELAESVKEDGNDGAHDGTLTRADAEDLHDFCFELLERIYTEPARLEAAKTRRAERRRS